jgi:heterotetrameric sarcosine oxidase gamma subunit
VAEPVARGPFAATTDPGPHLGHPPVIGPAVVLTDYSHQPRWYLHGKTAQRLTQSLAYRPGAVWRRGDLLLWSFAPVQVRAAWIGAPLDTDGRLPDHLWADLSPEDLTNVTHGVATVRMVGSSVPEVLARICPIDPRQLPDNHAMSTSMAQVTTEVLRADGDTPAYLLSVGRSYGPYLWGVLSEAAAELEAGPDVRVPALPRRVTNPHHDDV